MTREEIEKNIRKCENCGTENFSVKDEFTCTKCGRVNKNDSTRSDISIKND